MSSIAEIGGEFELIKKLTVGQDFNHDPRIKLALGDDASVIQIGNQYIAISTDTFVENYHFNWNYFIPEDLGIRVVEASFSDIVAVGAKPAWCWVSLAIPSSLSVDRLESIYTGIYSALKRLNATLQGGETVKSAQGLTITVTVMGTINNEMHIKKRSSAIVGDKVYISGPLGLADAGLRAFQNKASGFDGLKRAHLRPKARVDMLEQVCQANAVIDISDGLASELNHIARMSNVGIRIYAEKLPILDQLQDFCNQYNLSPLDLILNGGEDFELLYTVSAEHSNESWKYCIGEVTTDNSVVMHKEGQVVQIGDSGYNHFK